MERGIRIRCRWPQTKRKYRTRFKTVGEDISLLSKFYAASLRIEQTRRNRAEINKDWRLDNDIMIIAWNHPTELSQRGRKLHVCNRIDQLHHRYNIRISAGRIFRNWLKFFNGCLNWYTSNDDFYFASGKVTTTWHLPFQPRQTAGDGVSFSENRTSIQGRGFIHVHSDSVRIWTPDNMEWVQNHADLSKERHQGKSDEYRHVPCHIVSVEYHVTEGKAKFKVLQGQTTGLYEVYYDSDSTFLMFQQSECWLSRLWNGERYVPSQTSDKHWSDYINWRTNSKAMTISDSLPIQFWIPSSPTSTDPLTFNEKNLMGSLRKTAFSTHNSRWFYTHSIYRRNEG